MKRNDTCVAKTFGGHDDWRVGPVATFLQGDNQSQDVRKGALWQSRWRINSQKLY
jgi:hypothetical protein